MFAGVVDESVLLVVAQRYEGDPVTGERFGMRLQLDQLRATRRSPHGRSVEHHDRRPVATQLVYIDDLSGVGASQDVGKPLPNVGSGRKLAARIAAWANAGFVGPDHSELVFPAARLVLSGERLPLDHGSDGSRAARDRQLPRWPSMAVGHRLRGLILGTVIAMPPWDQKKPKGCYGVSNQTVGLRTSRIIHHCFER